MSAALLVSMALEIAADSAQASETLPDELHDLVDAHGLASVLDALREAADGAIDAHDDDPNAAGDVERLRTFSIGLATARGAIS